MRSLVLILLAAPAAASPDAGAVVVSTATEGFKAQLEEAADRLGGGARAVFDGARGPGRLHAVASRMRPAAAAEPGVRAAERPSDVVVKPGDTLSAIAERNGMSLARLTDLNGQIANPNLIHPGEAVRVTGVPAARAAPLPGQSYRIRAGDTLWGLSRQTGVSVRALAEANGIENPRLIYAGHFLHIPDGGSRPARAPRPEAPEAAPASQAQAAVMSRAQSVGRVINNSGGYRFDGQNDCYGYLRRVWDPVLAQHSQRPLPVADYPSPNWRPITNWSQLKPGDVLASKDGHQWGAQWHGGLYAGMRDGRPMVRDNSGSRDVSVHPNEVFDHYYVPTHKILTGN